MNVVLGLVMLILMLVGAYTIARTTVPWAIRRPRQIRSDHRAVEHLATDRFIRENEHELWPDKKLNHVNCAICGPGPLLQGMVPSEYEHPFYVMGKTWHTSGYSSWEVDVAQPSLPDTAEMVSSLIVKDDKATGTHTVMLDLDFPVTLVESSTPGHHHLYIDHVLTWRKYRKLLEALRDADLIERKFYEASLRNHATMLRPPWVKKTISAPESKPKPVKGKRLRHRSFNTGGKT